MKKKLIVCSLIFFVGFLYANEKSVWVTKEDINLKELILDEDGVTRIETEKFELKDDYTNLKKELELHRTEAKERILGIRTRLDNQIDAATIETIGDVVSNEFGVYPSAHNNFCFPSGNIPNVLTHE